MISLNKSFLYGTFFASITWIISLYLYAQLTKTDTNINLPSGIILRANNHVNSEQLVNDLQPDVLENESTNDEG